MRSWHRLGIWQSRFYDPRPSRCEGRGRSVWSCRCGSRRRRLRAHRCGNTRHPPWRESSWRCRRRSNRICSCRWGRTERSTVRDPRTPSPAPLIAPGTARDWHIESGLRTTGNTSPSRASSLPKLLACDRSCPTASQRRRTPESPTPGRSPSGCWWSHHRRAVPFPRRIARRTGPCTKRRPAP